MELWSCETCKLGRDFGSTIEVLEGISPSDRAIINPSDSLTAGER